MPVLIHSIPEYFDKLLQYRRLASIAFLRELRRVMVVAEDIPFMFIVRVLRAEDGRTDAAGEVFDVIFAVEGGDVGAAESTTAGVAEEVEASEVVGFAEWVLVGRVVGDGEEFGGYDFVAVLQ